MDATGMTLRASVVGLATWLVAIALPSAAQAPPDTTRAERQQMVLRELARDRAPFRDYAAHGDVRDCQNMLTDSYGLLAAIELRARGIDASIDGSRFPEEAAHIVSAIGATGAGRCAFLESGSPSYAQALVTQAFVLHEHGSGWSPAVRESFLRAAEVLYSPSGTALTNHNIDLAIGLLLLGEALGDTAVYTRGADFLRAIAEATYAHGFREAHSPLYTAEHFPALVFGLSLDDARGRALSRTLLDAELLIEAHHYLPGGGLLPPQSRNYAGGAVDPSGSRSLPPTLWALLGDPLFTPDLGAAYGFMIAGALDYALPAAIRDIFLDKQHGSAFWTRAVCNQGRSRTPNAIYDFGELHAGHRQVSPWQTYVLPGGAGGLGLEYGWNGQTIGVSSGAYARVGDGFAILYQYEPLVTGDTDDTGSTLGGSGLDADPDDFTSELYDYERILVGRTAASLWDPRPRSGVVRTHDMTMATVPSWESFGGESLRRGEWRIGRIGATYMAYHPLVGPGVTIGETAGTTSTVLRLPGQSGFVIEMATTDEFPSIVAYADDLATRDVQLTLAPFAVELDAFDGDARPRIRLEYRPERRFIDGVEQPTETLDHGLMESPWVTTDRAERRVTVQRGCNPILVYDWDDATFEELPLDPSCVSGVDGGVPDGGLAGTEPIDAGPPSGADAGIGMDEGATGCACRASADGRAPHALVPGTLLGLLLVWARRARGSTSRAARGEDRQCLPSRGASTARS